MRKIYNTNDLINILNKETYAVDINNLNIEVYFSDSGLFQINDFGTAEAFNTNAYPNQKWVIVEKNNFEHVSQSLKNSIESRIRQLDYYKMDINSIMADYEEDEDKIDMEKEINIVEAALGEEIKKIKQEEHLLTLLENNNSMRNF